MEDDNGYGGRRKLPFVFTEQGIAMLSAVLRSDVARDILQRLELETEE
ncbi:MAG: ORF6N domain-containing protein [Bacteroidales bacterium]|nr:ORF6N domain-containing protein [Bacteroidales bacterium]